MIRISSILLRFAGRKFPQMTWVAKEYSTLDLMNDLAALEDLRQSTFVFDGEMVVATPRWEPPYAIYEAMGSLWVARKADSTRAVILLPREMTLWIPRADRARAQRLVDRLDTPP